MTTPSDSSGSLASVARVVAGSIATVGGLSIAPNSYITSSGSGVGVWTSQSTFSGPLRLQDNVSGEEVEMNAELLITLKLLLEEINNIPDSHPLVDLKRGLQVRQAMRTLGKK